MDFRVEHRKVGFAEIVKRGGGKLAPCRRHVDSFFSNEYQSKVIESVVMGLGVGQIVLDIRDDENWVIVDGAARIAAMMRFVLGKHTKFALQDLDLWPEANGKVFEELSRPERRLLENYQFDALLIYPGTSNQVVESIRNRFA